MRLLTLADGYGDSTTDHGWYPAFYKWPEIVNLLTRNVALTNLSRYGAGNEYLIQLLRKNIRDKDTVLIQWAKPNRFDLLLGQATDFWTQQQNIDDRYRSNIKSVGSDQYWLSSHSQAPAIQDYHQKYISLRQHQTRSQLYIDHATLLLQKHQIDHGFLLNADSDYLAACDNQDINWIWHDSWKGMYTFRLASKFADLQIKIEDRLHKHQCRQYFRPPISLVQFDFVTRYLMPKINLPWRNARDVAAVENMLWRKTQEALATNHDPN